jgi:phage-related protein
MSYHLKALIPVGTSLRELRSMPDKVRQEFGFALFQVQSGNMPRGIKKLHGFSATVHEIRVRHDKEAYRVAYTVALGDRVYLLHAFHKKSKHGTGIPPQDIEIIRQRLKEAERMEAMSDE